MKQSKNVKPEPEPEKINSEENNEKREDDPMHDHMVGSPFEKSKSVLEEMRKSNDVEAAQSSNKKNVSFAEGEPAEIKVPST